MKTTTWLLAVLTAFFVAINSAISQDATPEQIARMESEAVKNYSNPTKSVDLMVLRRLEMLRANMPMPPMPFIDYAWIQELRMRAFEKMPERRVLITGGNATIQSPEMMFAEGSANEFYGNNSFDFGTCGQDEFAFYGLPPFGAGTWHTDTTITYSYPWSLKINTLPGGTLYEALSTTYNNPYLMTSVFYHSVTNHKDVYGDNLNHRLSFYYKWDDLGYSNIYCVILGNNADLAVGAVVTNMSNTVSWTRATVIVPPDTINASNVTTKLSWTVFKNNTFSTGGVARLQAVQWCPEIRPLNEGLRIQTEMGQPLNVKVSWSHVAKPTNFWKLVFAPTIPLNWSTNGLVVTVTNNIASYTIPATNSMRFYQLVHR